MFNGPDFPKPLEEQVFNTWLEQGRESKISYRYLLVIWDAYDLVYQPIYVSDRDEIGGYERYNSAVGREALIAAYDLFSESRIV